MFDEILKNLRESRGLTVQAVADELGVSRSLISMYETGKRKPSYEMLEALADFFNVSISELTDDSRTNDADNELWEIREILRRRPEMRTLFSLGKNASADDVKKAIAIITALRKANDDE